MIDHIWHNHPRLPYLLLQGYSNASVRTKPMRCGRYLWQFRKVVGYAATLRDAIDCVEAGSEFFQVFRRNPWG